MFSPRKEKGRECTRSRPERAGRMVGLPAPFEPSKDTISAGLTVKQTPVTALACPYQISRSLTSSILLLNCGKILTFARHLVTPDVCVDDARAVADLVWQSDRPNPALLHHPDSIRTRHHQRHVVLDQDHRDAEVADLPDQLT